MNRVLIIFLAVLIGLFGLRLLLTGFRTIIMFIKMESVPVKAKEGLFRDLLFGVLFVILAIAMLF